MMAAQMDLAAYKVQIVWRRRDGEVSISSFFSSETLLCFTHYKDKRLLIDSGALVSL
jgi:hypothetical protein